MIEDLGLDAGGIRTSPVCPGSSASSAAGMTGRLGDDGLSVAEDPDTGPGVGPGPVTTGSTTHHVESPRHRNDPTLRYPGTGPPNHPAAKPFQRGMDPHVSEPIDPAEGGEVKIVSAGVSSPHAPPAHDQPVNRQSPTDPIEALRPDSTRRWVYRIEVYCAGTAPRHRCYPNWLTAIRPRVALSPTILTSPARLEIRKDSSA